MTKKSTSFQRKVSPFERLYLSGMNVVPPLTIQIFVEGTGTISIEHLRNASKKAAESCPGSRLIYSNGDGSNGTWKDSGQAPPVREVVRGNFNGFNFDSLSPLRDRLDPIAGPTCEILLIQGDPGTLVFRAFHGVMDGKGTLAWIEQVFRALRQEDLKAHSGTKMESELLDERGVKTYRSLKLNAPFPFRLNTGTIQETDSFFWKRRVIRGTQPALAAKIISVISRFSIHSSIRVMVPVDLRRHEPSLNSTANLSLPLILDIQSGEPWEDIHQTLIQNLSKNQELAWDGSEWFLSKLPLKWVESLTRAGIRLQNHRSRYLASAMVSHLGRVDLKAFSFDGFSAQTIYSLPVHSGFIPFSIVAVECPEQVEITLSSSQGNGLEAEANELLDRIGEACASPAIILSSAFNGATRNFSKQQTATEIFERQVAQSPQAIALIWKTTNSQSPETMTYLELNRQADLIANLLRTQGVGPGIKIGILANRTARTIAGILGIWKAGAAYLPLDPQNPDSRLAWMLEDAEVPICLAQGPESSRLASFFAGGVIDLETMDSQTNHSGLSSSGVGSDLAYVIYTSGSTGRPKGVQIEHHSLVNYAVWAIDTYRLNPETRFPLFTSLAFDLSATALFLPLLCGGSLELFPDALNHVMLRQILEDEKINALKLTPTHLDLIRRFNLKPVGIRVIVVGGEQLKGTVAAETQKRFGPQCRIINEYGPTEATVGCIIHEYNFNQDDTFSPVPIGKPAANMSAYLLNSELNLVQPGEVGELYLAGAGLARGYINREDLNEQKFIYLKNGERAYRTGDLARVLDSGELEFLGRADHQIKIRGYLVEPEEVEAALLQNPALTQACVLARSITGTEDLVLCAYFVTQQKVSEEQIRTELEGKLPHYLIPSVFVELESMPITENGKLNIYDLPLPPENGSRLSPTFTIPDELEQKIAHIWAQVLRINPQTLTPQSNFYYLGGDSLKMTEMFSSVAEQLIPAKYEEKFMKQMQSIIKNPTPKNLSRAILIALDERSQTKAKNEAVHL